MEFEDDLSSGHLSRLWSIRLSLSVVPLIHFVPVKERASSSFPRVPSLLDSFNFALQLLGGKFRDGFIDLTLPLVFCQLNLQLFSVSEQVVRLFVAFFHQKIHVSKFDALPKNHGNGCVVEVTCLESSLDFLQVSELQIMNEVVLNVLNRNRQKVVSFDMVSLKRLQVLPQIIVT